MPRLVDIDITARADGKLVAWDASAGTHEYIDPPAGGSLSYLVNQLSGNVNMNAANTFFDGPSLSLTEGTWLLMGSVTLSPAAPDICVVKLWDGTTVADAKQLTFEAGVYPTPPHLSGVAVVGAGGATWKISAASQSTTTGFMLATPTVNATGLTNKASTLVAVKIA